MSDFFILFIKVTDKVLNFLVRFISDVNYGSAIIYSNMTILSFLLFSFGLIFSSDVINISFRKKLVISTSFIALSIIVSQLFI